MLGWGGSAPAQMQYGVDVWTVDNGLPQNLIRGLAQSPDGYLWIATFDGLVRFDGMRFTTFNQSNTPGIASNRFASMYQGKDADLWLANEIGGITRYRNGSFRNYGTEDGIPSSVVDGLAGDDAGNMWILSADRILKWNGTADRFADITPTGSKIHYRPTYWQTGGFWGQDGDSLYLFLRGRFITYALPQAPLRSPIWNVALDQRGTIWVEDLDGKQICLDTTNTEAAKFAAASPTVAYFGSDGHLWPMSVGHRLTRSLKFLSSGKPVTVPVTQFFGDRQNNLWLGTEGQGLYRLQRQSISVYSKEQGLADRDVYGIYQDGSQAIWIGAWHTGLSKFKDGKFTNYTVADGLPALLVTALEEDRSGQLWVGTHGGLVVFDHGRFHKPTGPILPDRAVVQSMHQDRAGAFWFGTNRGLVRYQDGGTKVFTERDGLAADDIHVIIEDRAGDLWFGGYGGLTRLHAGHFTHWSDQDGLPGKNIWSIYEDREGVIWIGTYDRGLGRFQNGKFTRYTEREGLFSDGVFQILEDEQGNFWISCNRGIYRVSKTELNALAAGSLHRVHSVAYGKIDGILDPECNGGIWPAGMKARDGKLWFPTQDGVAVVDPKTITYDPQTPPVAIESASIDRISLPVNTPLRIAPHQDNLEINYTAPSFIKADQIRFRYKLEGLESDWVDAGSRRTAYYSHLPPGNYVFSVIAENSDGIWNVQGKTLSISVLAPFYKKWWFFAILLLFSGALLLLFANRRITQLQRAKAVQQAFSQQLIASQEGERKRIAAELHDSLGQRLVVINNLALFALRAFRERSGDDPEIHTIEEISSEATSAIEETRTISYNLRPFQLDRLGLTKSIEALIRTASKSSGITFTKELANVDDAFSEDVRINFYRIVQEGLSNILKHSHATEASVHIVRNADQVILNMQDNGKGFTPSSRLPEKPQGGFGMTGMAERASLLGGTLKVRSIPGNGTVMTVEIPLGANRHG
jgi:signal transduction histidine kinase/ligand-binding sensor domain-containing protein